MTDVEVRLADPADYPALAALYAAWGYDGGLTPAEAVFVAYADGGTTPVGIVRRTREEGVVMLRGMQVAPAARRRGVGRRLLAAFAAHTDERVSCYCVPYRHLVGFYGAVG